MFGGIAFSITGSHPHPLQARVSRSDTSSTANGEGETLNPAMVKPVREFRSAFVSGSHRVGLGNKEGWVWGYSVQCNFVAAYSMQAS